ncbi:MAG: hypothetical protein MI864_14925 [Pseudomonadales bacterium]|nr:hypothetical protein [Pseudomonadales bacterium]
MDYRFLNLDLPVTTFEGLSLPYQRKVALVATFLIWVGLAFAGFIGAQRIGPSAVADDIAAIFVLGTVLYYIVSGDFIVLSGAKALLNATPMGVLYRQDRSVLDKAKAELLLIASQVNFRDYLGYGKVNPEIRARGSLLVIAHQEKGDLSQWVNNPHNLKLLANLVYQIHLVEKLLAGDSMPQTD